jgi:hypothetical protein
MIISLSLANWYGGTDFTGNRAVKVTFGASFKRRSGKFAANPSVLDYFRMPVAKQRPGSVERGSGPFFFWSRLSARSEFTSLCRNTLDGKHALTWPDSEA